MTVSSRKQSLEVAPTTISKVFSQMKNDTSAVTYLKFKV